MDSAVLASCCSSTCIESDQHTCSLLSTFKWRRGSCVFTNCSFCGGGLLKGRAWTGVGKSQDSVRWPRSTIGLEQGPKRWLKSTTDILHSTTSRAGEREHYMYGAGRLESTRQSRLLVFLKQETTNCIAKAGQLLVTTRAAV